MTDIEPSPRTELLDRAVAWFATNGIGDTSLRGLAAGVGSSHRMLLYHFGSRERLLAAVVDEVWRRHRQAFAALDAAADPVQAAWTFWCRLADQVDIAPLYVELSAAAMQGREWAAEPVRRLMTEWLEVLAQFFVGLGNPPERAELLARTSVGLIRGTMEVLVLTDDRQAADDVIAGFLRSLSQPPPSGAAPLGPVSEVG